MYTNSNNLSEFFTCSSLIHKNIVGVQFHPEKSTNKWYANLFLYLLDA